MIEVIIDEMRKGNFSFLILIVGVVQAVFMWVNMNKGDVRKVDTMEDKEKFARNKCFALSQKIFKTAMDEKLDNFDRVIRAGNDVIFEVHFKRIKQKGDNE